LARKRAKKLETFGLLLKAINSRKTLFRVRLIPIIRVRDCPIIKGWALSGNPLWGASQIEGYYEPAAYGLK
jgi:hypothetical protein